MVIDGVLFAFGLSCSLQDDTPICLHDCVVVNGTSTSIIYIYLHGTAARVLTSGHPPETKTMASKSGHPPGTQKQIHTHTHTDPPLGGSMRVA